MNVREARRMEHAHKRYLEATPKSAAKAEEARRYMPDGISRSGVPYQFYPIFLERGEGQYLYDLDGRRILDLVNGHSALALGHAHPAVVAAVAQQVTRGTGLGLMESTEVELAAMLQERFPSMELLRFTASGTEATMYAVRLARAFTRRPKFARFEGSYHGLHDMMCSGMGMNIGGSWAGSNGEPVSLGVSPSVAGEAVFLPYNDLAGCERILAGQADELACVIVEPILGGGGGIPSEPAFLRGMRELCERSGILLVFDEMISAGLAPGGAQEFYQIAADVTTGGKVLGGGMPMGVVGGRADIMRLCEAKNGVPEVFHTGTWNGHPLAMAAGVAQLRTMTPEVYERLGELGDYFREGVRRTAAKGGVQVQVTGLQHFSCIHYTDQPVRNHRDARRSNATVAKNVAFSLLSQGFYLLGGRSNLSVVTTHEDLDRFFEALAIAFEEAGAAGA